MTIGECVGYRRQAIGRAVVQALLGRCDRGAGRSLGDFRPMRAGTMAAYGVNEFYDGFTLLQPIANATGLPIDQVSRRGDVRTA